MNGFGAIELLMAILIIGVVTLAVMGVATLTTRLGIDGERQTVALNLAREKIEYIRTLSYAQVGLTSGSGTSVLGGILPPEEIVSRNDQPYTVLIDVVYVDDPRTPTGDDFKKVRVEARWMAPSEASRRVVLITFVSALVATSTPPPSSSPSPSSTPSPSPSASPAPGVSPSPTPATSPSPSPQKSIMMIWTASWDASAGCSLVIETSAGASPPGDPNCADNPKTLTQYLVYRTDVQQFVNVVGHWDYGVGTGTFSFKVEVYKQYTSPPFAPAITPNGVTYTCQTTKTSTASGDLLGTLEHLANNDENWTYTPTAACTASGP